MNTRGTAVDQEGFIFSDCALVIENVEPVELQTELLILTQRNRVVSTEIQVVGGRRAIAAGKRVDCRAAWYATEAWNTEAFVVTIERVRNQSVERNTRLRTERTAGHQFEWPLIAAVKLELMRTIVRQSSVKTVEQADEVEQRSDVRVRLAVVVAEQTFVVSDQAGVHVRSDELVVVREPLGGGELECAVVTTRRAEATDR